MYCVHGILLGVKASDNHNIDLLFYHCGEQACHPGHRWRSVRSYYLFHYILSGSGTAFFDSKAVKLTAGEGFLYTPKEISDYQADLQTPWHYLWIAFSGRQADNFLQGVGLDQKRRIYRSENPEKTARALSTIVKHLALDPPFFEKTALLYRAFSILDANRQAQRPYSPDRSIADDYISAIHDWIQENYQDPNASVQAMADRMGLCRTYLSTLVKKKTGKTPQELLLVQRMTTANTLLYATALPISQIANRVGYPDPLSFSRSFKRWFSYSPREARRRHSAGEAF